MRTGELAHHFGVTTQTLRRWIQTFPKFFSDEVKDTKRRQADFTPDDLLILATINHLSKSGYGLKQIRLYLEDGYRVDEAILSKPDTSQDVSLPAPDMTEKLLKMQDELRQALQQNTQLNEALQKAETHQQTLQQRVEELQYRLGLAEGELNVLRRQLENKA